MTEPEEVKINTNPAQTGEELIEEFFGQYTDDEDACVEAPLVFPAALTRRKDAVMKHITPAQAEEIEREMLLEMAKIFIATQTTFVTYLDGFLAKLEAQYLPKTEG